MTPQESTYRSVVNRLAIVMLIWYGSLNIYRLIASEILPLVVSGMQQITATIVTELTLALLYAVAFLVPVFVFYGISKGKASERFDAAFYLPRGTLLYILAAVAIIGVAAYLNSYFLSLFDGISVFQSESADASSVPRTDYELILAFISTAIVPAFVEEALFRGLILKNLLPYGRTTAVLASALLFGIMHQNAAQFFYATVAGLVIGYIYVHTRSLWCCVLIHFANNAFSVLNSILRERLPTVEAVIADYLVYFVLFLLGILAAVLLIFSQKDRRTLIFTEGCFERELTPDPEHATAALCAGRRVKLFFSVPMIIYLALCAVQVLYTLFYEVLF